MAAKPVVDGLAQEWTTGQIIRVDVFTSSGRRFAAAHRFEGTPTFILFDGSGKEMKRWRRPPAIGELTE